MIRNEEKSVSIQILHRLEDVDWDLGRRVS